MEITLSCIGVWKQEVPCCVCVPIWKVLAVTFTVYYLHMFYSFEVTVGHGKILQCQHLIPT